MKRIDIIHEKVKSDGSAILTVETDPVDDGEVLIVNTITGYHDNQATTEVTEFFITDGATEIKVHAGVPKVAGYPVPFSGRVVVPSGYCVGVRCPSAANTEIMYLSVTGEVMTFEGYRKMNMV